MKQKQMSHTGLTFAPCLLLYRWKTHPDLACFSPKYRKRTTFSWEPSTPSLVSQVTFIYIALLTIQIVAKQLQNIKIGK